MSGNGEYYQIILFARCSAVTCLSGYTAFFAHAIPPIALTIRATAKGKITSGAIHQRVHFALCLPLATTVSVVNGRDRRYMIVRCHHHHRHIMNCVPHTNPRSAAINTIQRKHNDSELICALNATLSA